MIDPCPEIARNWTHVHPPVGMWIAVLALFGVLVPLFRSWGKIGRGEKALWTAAMFLLVFLEIRTLYLDRAEHDADQNLARCREVQSFREIAGELRSSIQNNEAGFSATIGHVDDVLSQTEAVDKLAKKSLENITGGDSYLVVIPDVAYSGDQITFSVVNRGTSILAGTSILITTQGVFWPGVRELLMEAVSQRLQLPPMHPGERMVIDRRVDLLKGQPDGSTEPIYVTISGPNFSSEEYLEFRKVGKDSRGEDAWQYKYKIFRRRPYHIYRKGEKVRKDQLLEETEWTTDNDPKFPIPKQP